MGEPVNFDVDCDTRGLKCPLPVMKARKRMKPLPPGTILRLVADDPLAAIDVPNFCREDGHGLIGSDDKGGVLTFYIAKG
ncbi:SirA family protein [Stappia sp. 22II-S9-Z10]|nr:SirA family protein [Stappia sp. 22II-S9-Z10]